VSLDRSRTGDVGGSLPLPDLSEDQRRRLEIYLDCLAKSHVSLSSVREGAEAWRVHVLDSLSGLLAPQLSSAKHILDLGSGAGFPGAVLAVMKPGTEVDLLESVQRKCEFMQSALAEAGIDNARPVCARSEEWAAGQGREAYDAVTARAVAPLAALAELASPLLREGGFLVAWKGARDLEEEGAAAAIADKTAMEPAEVLPVVPFKGSRDRHLHLLKKAGPTPANLPRRPGMARKRPLT
jgi:16S rRNA (guanine527-N7)-methyltransferase